MNNPNPFIPQGSLQEQKNQKRARVKFAVFSIFALNILIISPLLIQGCKREPAQDTLALIATNAPDTNMVDTNLSTALPPMTNLPPQTSASNSAPAYVPPTPPPEPVTPAASGQEYVVVKGDSYYSIGKKYHVGYKAVEAANPAIPANKLKVGDKIQIPGATASSTPATGNSLVASDTGEAVYVVKSGDTLQKIAKAHGTTAKAIRAANSLKTDKIKVAQKLKIPAKSGSTSASAPVETPMTTPAMPSPTPLAPAPTPATPTTR